MSARVREASESERAAILAVESRRQQALLDVDADALAAVLDDALVHIHAPGVVQTKSQLLEHLVTRAAYRGMERGEVRIRIVGDDVAIMTGRLTNRLGSPDGSERVVAGPVTQVLVRDDEAWRFVSFQMTPDGEQVWGALPSEQSAGR
ncbi:MAG TPA: nuclear transport factor 2 family protein [Microbacterium sp.]|nr:nuclear transport factor 2 family protein [Microbacterium sp.]